MDKKCGNGQNIKEWDYSASITIISKAIKMGGEGQKSLELEGGERLLIEKPHKQII